jgi:serine/threonine-protein kinase
VVAQAADVFVSYKAEDRHRVEPLVAALESEGLAVWWDARVTGGDAWRETIAEHLDAAACVIVVWSKRSTGPEGRFVRDEASRAQRRGSYLPITIDKVEPPLGFGETQALSLRGWKGDPADSRYRRVSECVHSLLGRKAPDRERGAIVASRGPPVGRRTALAAGGAGVLAAAAGGWFLLRPTGARANTIAVLPFANLSGDPSQNYFSDGMAEEVRSALASLDGLDVVARTSSEMLRNTDAIAAARKLSVANVITGSVRRSPSTVRVSAQLVDGQNGVERWSQSFDRPIGDVLQIQSDIAANVAKALSITLGSAARDRLSLGGTKDTRAQDLLLQATTLEGDDSSGALLRRIALLESAVRTDPNYAEAFARKAMYEGVWASTWASDNAEKDAHMRSALESARKSIAIEPRLPIAYGALALVYSNSLKFRPALAAGRRGVELPGAEGSAFSNYATLLSRTGAQAEAVAVIDRGLALDPLNAQAWALKSWILFGARRYRESIDAARRASSLAPANLRAGTLVAWNLIFLGNIEEAQAQLQTVPADDYRRIVAEAAIAARSKRKDDALLALERLRREYGETVAYQEAEIYAQLGDRDKAIEALERAWSSRDSGLSAVQVDPFLDPIRNDPRLDAIAKRVFG